MTGAGGTEINPLINTDVQVQDTIIRDNNFPVGDFNASNNQGTVLG